MKDSSIAEPMVSLLSSSLTLPDIVERSPKPVMSSPYLQQVGRKWETKKQREMKSRKKKKAAAAAAKSNKRKQQQSHMADLQHSIMSPNALDELSASMSFSKSAPVTNVAPSVPPTDQRQDDLSLSSVGDESTVGDVLSASSSVKQSFLENMLNFEMLGTGEEEDLLGEGPEDKSQERLHQQQPPSPQQQQQQQQQQHQQPVVIDEMDVMSALPEVSTPPPPLGTGGATINSASASLSVTSEYFDDPLTDAPVNLTVILEKTKSVCGKMIVMKKSSLSKIRHLLQSHYSSFIPKQFVFTGNPTSPSNAVKKKTEAFLQVSDISLFHSFDDRGVANMEIRIRPKFKSALPFSQCTNVEDFIRITKEENETRKRMAEAE